MACTGLGGTSPTASATVTVTTTPSPTGAITSFQLAGTGSAPFSVGVPIKKGDAPASLVTDLPTTQVIVATRWNDGSAKHAIVSGTATLPVTITLRGSATPPPAGLTAADIQKANPAASVALSGISTVTLSSLLANPFRTWISGPEMVEAHYRGPTPDPLLVVWYHVRLWKGGRVWVRAIVENADLAAAATKSYTGTVSIGGTQVFTSAMTHYAHTRWSVEGWVGTTPNVTPKHDGTYLMASRLVPNYWKRNPTDAAYTGFVQTYVPMQRGNLEPNMGAAGYQDSIGLVPRWDALYISAGDARAHRAILANSSSLNTYPVVWRDAKTFLPPRPSDHATYPGPGGSGTYNLSAGPNTWEYNHAPSEGYTAYLLTGDYWHYETMQFNAAINYLALGIGSGAGVNKIFTGETRGHAWALRTLMQYAGIAPTGDTVAADYRLLLANNMSHWNTVRASLGGVGTGYLYEYSFPYAVGTLAPWQDHFIIQTYGHGSDLEPLADMTAFLAVRDWWYRGIVGILGDAAGYCFTKASTYTMKLSDTSNTDPKTWYATWSQVYAATWKTAPCTNTMDGLTDPATVATGYWANLLPALAYAVDHGAAGASASWARVQGATNYSVLEGADWHNYPVWGIVARGTQPPITPPTGPTVSLTANPTSVTKGGASTLTWSSTNATGCTKSGAWSGSASASGTQSVSPASTSTYSMVCEGAGGQSPTSAATVTVTTTVIPPPTGQHPTFVPLTNNQAVLLGPYSCTQMAGDSPCGEISDYSRFTYDPDGRQMLMFGGGHAATFRDDVDVLATAPGAPLTWAPAYPPTPCAEMTLANRDTTQGKWISSGHPFSRHTYDMVVMTPQGLVMVAGMTGRGGCAPQADPDPMFTNSAVHYYNPVAKTWSQGPSIGNWSPYANAEYDPPSGKIIIIGYTASAGAATMWVYDPVARTIQNTGVNAPDVGIAGNLVYYPPTQKHYLIKDDRVYEVTLNRTNFNASTVIQLSVSGTGPPAGETGYAYDPMNQIIGGGIRNGIFYVFTPGSRAWSSLTMQAISGGPIGTLAFHAIDYDVANAVFIFLTDPASGRKTWGYRY